MSDEDAQPLTDEVADAGSTAADGLMARMRLNAGPADGWRQGWLKLKVKKKAQKAYFDSCGYRLNWYGSKPDTDGAKPSGGLDLRDVELDMAQRRGKRLLQSRAARRHTHKKVGSKPGRCACTATTDLQKWPRPRMKPMSASHQPLTHGNLWNRVR